MNFNLMCIASLARVTRFKLVMKWNFLYLRLVDLLFTLFTCLVPFAGLLPFKKQCNSIMFVQLSHCATGISMYM